MDGKFIAVEKNKLQRKLDSKLSTTLCCCIHLGIWVRKDLILYMMELVIGNLVQGGLVQACENLIPFNTRSTFGES